MCVDRKYCFDGAAVLRLASLLPPSTEVHAFYHLDSYEAQASRHPPTFGQADVFVQCDCDDVDEERACRAAAAALAPGGVALVMRGDGSIDCLHGKARGLSGSASLRSGGETNWSCATM